MLDMKKMLENATTVISRSNKVTINGLTCLVSDEIAEKVMVAILSEGLMLAPATDTMPENVSSNKKTTNTEKSEKATKKSSEKATKKSSKYLMKEVSADIPIKYEIVKYDSCEDKKSLYCIKVVNPESDCEGYTLRYGYNRAIRSCYSAKIKSLEGIQSIKIRFTENGTKYPYNGYPTKAKAEKMVKTLPNILLKEEVNAIVTAHNAKMEEK